MQIVGDHLIRHLVIALPILLISDDRPQRRIRSPWDAPLILQAQVVLHGTGGLLDNIALIICQVGCGNVGRAI